MNFFRNFLIMVISSKSSDVILTKRINTFMVRKDSSNDKMCFDVLVDGYLLTHGLTLGELLEFIVRTYCFCNASEFYVTDYPKIKVNVNK